MNRLLRAEGRKSGWGSNPGGVHLRRRDWSKDGALFPGRVPHVRPSVHGPKKTGRQPLQTLLLCGKKDCDQEQESLRME
jgi:hypothetical protein